MSTSSSEAAKLLAQPLTLPCSGLTAPNRLFKAPMEEMLGELKGGNLPNERVFELYRKWANGGWGMIITGNVAIDSTHLGTPFDITMPAPKEHSPKVVEAYRRYAQACKQTTDGNTAPLAVVQLVHAGRQSMRGLKRPLRAPAMAPSAVEMKTSANLGPFGKLLDWMLWSKPEEMSQQQINELIDRFAYAASVCYEAGFDGVEIHASHGYQVAAFLSPRTNVRKDKYGGSSENRMRLLLEIIDAVRKRVPSSSFAVGVKLNSSDYVQGGLTEDDALLNVQMLAATQQVDFIEISGGNYENPSFMMENFDSDRETAKISKTQANGSARAVNGSAQKQPDMRIDGDKSTPAPTARTYKREAFFQGFAARAREAVASKDSKMVLCLTGGLRTRTGMADPIRQGIVDAVAIGRPACVYPSMPKTLTNVNVPDSDARASPPRYVQRGSGVVGLLPLRIINAGWTTLWHVAMLSYLARGETAPNVHAGPIEVITAVFFPSLLHFARMSSFSVIASFVTLCISTALLFGNRASNAAKIK